MKTMRRHLHDPVPTPQFPGREDQSHQLRDIVRRCLQKEPDDRFQTVDDITLVLRRHLAPTLRVTATHAGPVSGMRPEVWIVLLFLAGAVLSSGLGAVGIALWASQELTSGALPPPPTPAGTTAPPAARHLLRTDPPGATVWHQGEAVGTTPIALDAEDPIITVTLEGYEPIQVDPSTLGASDAPLVLQPKAPDPTPSASRPPARPRPTPPSEFQPVIRTER